MRDPGKLPDFLIIGAMKSGSTTLFNYLRQHPRIFLPEYKEPEFFVAEKNWHKGVDWYRRLFAGAGGAVAVGEASTSYAKCTEFEGVPARVHAVIPDVRLVYVLRDPVQRMVSMYRHMVITGGEQRALAEALLEDDKYMGASSYFRNLSGYLELFDRSQMLVLLSEDLAQDHVAVVERTLDFLGLALSTDFRPDERRDLATESRRADRRLKTMLRDVPAAHLMHQRLPPWARGRLRTLTSRARAVPFEEPSPQLLAELQRRIRPDVQQLRECLGPQIHGWGLLDVDPDGTADQPPNSRR